MGSTSIEWATHSWNPGVYGCEEVSPACANCYAAKMAHRLVAMGNYPDGITTKRASGVHWSGEVKVHRAYDERLDQWRDEVLTHDLPKRGPARVFTTSMGDLFHKAVPLDFLVKVFAEIERRPWADFLVLTKRPERFAEFSETYRLPNNVWAGTTVENQKYADERVPHLLRIRGAAVRFLSVEPMLGPIDLLYAAFNGADSFGSMAGIDWVIAGGESGSKARPSSPAWFRDLRDQCVRAKVAFFFKQWGQWGLVDRGTKGSIWLGPDGTTVTPALPDPPFGRDLPHEWALMAKIGRAESGRMLDGRTWDELPALVRR